MKFLRWSDGPKQYGCVYHKRAVHKLADEDVVVDVFVMPSVRDQRPVALTIGRYRNYEPVRLKQKAGFNDPGVSPGRLEDVSSMFDRIGVDAELSAYLADEVDQFLIQEAASIRTAIEASSP
jgi:hypothetical protein